MTDRFEYAIPPDSPYYDADADLERPLGVTLLSVLHVVGGMLLLGAEIVMFQKIAAAEEGLRAAGIAPVLMVIGTAFLAVLSIASGVGMWLGTAWGWWCVAFYYVYSIFRNAGAIVMVFTMADQFEGATRGAEYYVVRYGLRILVHFLLLQYFFRDRVLAYFGLEAMDKASARTKLIGVCFSVGAVATAINWLTR